MIYITGDTHRDIDISKLNTRMFPEQKSLTKSDYVIICGDFGMVWDNSNTDLYWRKWLDDKPWTTLFIDGNHDNHSLIYAFPEVDMFDGKVRKVSDSIYYLQRGQVFNIDGKSILAIGGADSVDKEWRLQYQRETGEQIWWESEQISEYDILLAMNAVQHNYDGVIDIVISHAAPYFIEKQIGEYIKHTPSSRLLGYLAQQIKFNAWYFGHYHTDASFTDEFGCKYTGLYQNVQLI